MGAIRRYPCKGLLKAHSPTIISLKHRQKSDKPLQHRNSMRFAVFFVLLLILPMISGCLEDEIEPLKKLDISQSELDTMFLEEIAGSGLTVCDAAIKITYGLEKKMAYNAAATAFSMVAVGGGPAGLIGAVAMYGGAESAEYMVNDYCADGDMDQSGEIVTNAVLITLKTLNTLSGRSNNSSTPQDGDWVTNSSYIGEQIGSDSIQLNTAHRKGYHINVNENGDLELVAVFSLEFLNGNYEQTFLSQNGDEILTQENLSFNLFQDHLEFHNSKGVPLKAGFVKWAYDADNDLILSFTFEKEQVTTVCSARIRGYQSEENPNLFNMQIMLDIVSANSVKTPLILGLWFDIDTESQTASSEQAFWRQNYEGEVGSFEIDGWNMIPVEQISPAIQKQDGYCRPTPWLD